MRRIFRGGRSDICHRVEDELSLNLSFGRQGVWDYVPSWTCACMFKGNYLGCNNDAWCQTRYVVQFARLAYIFLGYLGLRIDVSDREQEGGSRY